MSDRGFWHFSPVSNGMGAHGIPDIIACAPVTVTPQMVGRVVGLFVGVEAKALGKRSNVSELQKHQIERIKAAGGIALVVDDVSQLEGELREKGVV